MKLCSKAIHIPINALKILYPSSISFDDHYLKENLNKKIFRYTDLFILFQEFATLIFKLLLSLEPSLQSVHYI